MGTLIIIIIISLCGVHVQWLYNYSAGKCPGNFYSKETFCEWATFICIF